MHIGKAGKIIQLSSRQMELLELVKKHAPVTGEQLAEFLNVSRPTLRSDLSLLVMLGMLDAKPKVGYFLGNTYQSNGGPLRKLHEMKLREIQGISVNIPETLSVHDAVVTLFTENADTLLVVNEQKYFVGIITPKDLLKITLGNPSASNIPVSMVMTRYPNIVTLHPDDSVLDAIQRMAHHRVDCLPVIRCDELTEHHPHVIGWVSHSNITRLLADIATSQE